MNKKFLIAGLFLLAVAATLFAYGAIVGNAVPVSTAAEKEKTASFTGIPCDEVNPNELPKDMSEIARENGLLIGNQQYSPATGTNSALFSGECGGSQVNYTTVCESPMVSGTSQVNCTTLSCYTNNFVYSGTYTNTTSSTYASADCGRCNGQPVCKWARINFSRNVTKQVLGVFGQGIRCDRDPGNYPASCSGISLSVFHVLGLRKNANGQWESAPCAFYTTPEVSNSCISSGSLNNCNPIDAPLCAAPLPPITPSGQCITDLLNQELANGNCRRV